MKQLRMIGLWVMVVLIWSCAPGDQGNRQIDTGNKKAALSYSVGYSLAKGISQMALEFDLESLVQGFRDSASGQVPQIPDQEITQIFNRFQNEVRTQATKRKQEMVQKNTAKETIFMQENKKKEGVVETESGLQYQVIKEGDGPLPKEGDKVKIHLRGTFITGQEFSSTFNTGAPEILTINEKMIRGFSEGLKMMKENSKFKLFIPAHLAYGDRGCPPGVEPGAMLIYEVELLKVIPAGSEAK